MQKNGATGNLEALGDGVAGLDRFLPLEGEGTGYGVAAYVGSRTLVCRLYDLCTGELVTYTTASGDYASFTADELKNLMTEVFETLASAAGISLSKLKVAVMSGSTAMEVKAAGVEQEELVDDGSEDCECFGCDVEYMLVGSSAIAVGQAFYVPCLDAELGGDFLCSLLAIDILGSKDPVLFISGGSQDGPSALIAYGNQEAISVAVLPNGSDVEQGLERLFELCEVEYDHIAKAIVAGDADVVVPQGLMDHVKRIEYPAIIGASAVLLSEDAEDELCQIVSECQLVEL